MGKYVDVEKEFCSVCEDKENCKNVACDVKWMEYENVVQYKEVYDKVMGEIDDAGFKDRIKAMCYKADDDFVRGYVAGMLRVLDIIREVE